MAAIDTSVFLSDLGITSINTDAINQYEFYQGIVWSDASVTNTQYEFYQKLKSDTYRYGFYKTYTNEYLFYTTGSGDGFTDTNIVDFYTFYKFTAVAGVGPGLPTAGFTYSITTGGTNNDLVYITFNDTSVDQTTSTVDFGNGITATDPSTDYEVPYLDAGSYNISLTASNAGGSDNYTVNNAVNLTCSGTITDWQPSYHGSTSTQDLSKETSFQYQAWVWLIVNPEDYALLGTTGITEINDKLGLKRTITGIQIQVNDTNSNVGIVGNGGYTLYMQNVAKEYDCSQTGAADITGATLVKTGNITTWGALSTISFDTSFVWDGEGTVKFIFRFQNGTGGVKNTAVNAGLQRSSSTSPYLGLTGGPGGPGGTRPICNFESPTGWPDASTSWANTTNYGPYLKISASC